MVYNGIDKEGWLKTTKKEESESRNASARKSGGNKSSSDRSSGNKSDSPWAKATGNKARRNNNQNRTQSGNR